MSVQTKQKFSPRMFKNPFTIDSEDKISCEEKFLNFKTDSDTKEVDPNMLLYELNKALLYAMPEPCPAKTKISIEMNSARAALSASALPNSEGFPMAILEIGIFFL